MMMRTARRRGRRGFTLIEMIVATIILAIGLVGTVWAFNAATKASSLAAEEQTASLLGQQQLAENEANAAGQISGGDSEGDFGKDYPGFHWHQTVTATDYTYLFQVAMTVQWGANPVRERTITTYEVNTQNNTGTPGSSGTATGATGG